MTSACPAVAGTAMELVSSADTRRAPSGSARGRATCSPWCRRTRRPSRAMCTRDSCRRCATSTARRHIAVSGNRSSMPGAVLPRTRYLNARRTRARSHVLRSRGRGRQAGRAGDARAVHGRLALLSADPSRDCSRGRWPTRRLDCIRAVTTAAEDDLLSRWNDGSDSDPELAPARNAVHVLDSECRESIPF